MKYYNKKCIFMGISFDSTKERDRYIVLKDMERKGEIQGLELQKEFETLPRIVRNEVVQLKTKTKIVERIDERATHYHADFFYFDVRREQYVIEEVKSKATALIRDYALRRKLVKMMIMKMNAEAGKELYVFNEIIK